MTSVYIPTWDDMYTPEELAERRAKEPQAQPPELIVDVALLAQTSIAQLDTQAAVAELDQIGDAIMAKAQSIVERMNAHLESGGRVSVDAKRLINSKADLNQVVPIKYQWVWNLYLKASAQHWMPADIDLTKDRLAWQSRTVKASEKAAVGRALLTFRSRYRTCEDLVLLNIYRLVTNPECRQYVLRQNFEAVALKYAWDYISDELNDGDLLSHVVDNQGQPLKQVLLNTSHCIDSRDQLLKEIFKPLRDPTFNTTQLNDQQTFLMLLIIFYGYLNSSMMLASYYPVYDVAYASGGWSITQLLDLMIRDIATQSVFAEYLIKGIISENPGLVTDPFMDRLTKTLNQLIGLDLDVYSVLANTDTQYREVSAVLYGSLYQSLTSFGLNVPQRIINGFNKVKDSKSEQFLNRILTMSKQHMGGLGGDSGKLAW